MDIGWYLWLTWIGLFLVIEGVAIKTNAYDTLSEKLWYVSKKRKVYRVALIAFFLWALIHIGGGECFLGICF